MHQLLQAVQVVTQLHVKAQVQRQVVQQHVRLQALRHALQVAQVIVLQAARLVRLPTLLLRGVRLLRP